MKRVVTIQDISCVGKCSLTVALPVISAMGVETAIVPTAVLSTHTMFKDFTFCDLTDQMDPIRKHWMKENFEFDALYTGYLGSKEQIDLVSDYFDTFKTESNFTFVDPVMADNGKLYPLFDLDFASRMAKLCAKADIIVPNLTEACFLTGVEYRETMDEEYLTLILNKLADLGTRKAVILTGVSMKEGMTGVAGMNVADRKIFRYEHRKISRSYHGTGDIFSSTTVGALALGKDLEEALRIAADFTVDCIETTMENDPQKTYGVNFELVIPRLIERLNKA